MQNTLAEPLPASPAAPPRTSAADIGFHALAMATCASLLITVFFIAFRVPAEATMGVVQKIFYFHAPSAYAMYFGAGVCFLGSAAYLAQGARRWDAIAKAGAEVAVAMGFMVMISGPLWAMKAWGVSWTWDPRLTTSMLSVLIYVAYVLLRAFAGDGDAERKFAAALGILGAANLPIIHYSVQKWGGNHPKVITSGGGGLQHPDMKITLSLGFLSFTLLAILLVWMRARTELASARLAELEQEALEEGMGGD
jgi:heme exporter protein C